MAQAVVQVFNRLGALGLGLAIAGGVASTALYNGKERGEQTYFTKKSLTFFVDRSGRRTSGCYLRQISRRKKLCRWRRHSFHHPLGSEACDI